MWWRNRHEWPDNVLWHTCRKTPRVSSASSSTLKIQQMRKLSAEGVEVICCQRGRLWAGVGGTWRRWHPPTAVVSLAAVHPPIAAAWLAAGHPPTAAGTLAASHSPTATGFLAASHPPTAAGFLAASHPLTSAWSLVINMETDFPYFP